MQLNEGDSFIKDGKAFFIDKNGDAPEVAPPEEMPGAPPEEMADGPV